MIYRLARLKLLSFVILLFAAAAQIFAAAGDLDWTFGTDGIVVTDHDEYGSEGIGDLAVQPDGKIIAIGYSNHDSIQRLVVVRYQPNGNIDPTFGTGGKVIIQSRTPGHLALQPDGKIVFVSPGGGSPFSNFYVVRLNSDGSFDTTFNGTGTVNVNLRGTNDRAYSVKIQTDGKIVVGGTSSRTLSSSPDDIAIVRFNADGSLDNTFDGDGKVFTMIAAQRQYNYFSELAVQPDGKIVTVGALLTYNINGEIDSEDFLVIRYNSNGSPDTGFDGDGIVTTRFAVPPAPRTDVYANSVAVQTNGKLVVVGSAAVHRTTVEELAAVARYNTDGSLDSSFAIGGKTLIVFPPFPDAWGSDVVIQADNKIVIGGTASTSNANERNPAVARLNADGSFDSGFSGDGANVITGTPNRHSLANAVAIQPSGKIITGGYSGWNNGSDFLILRFEGATCTVNCAPPREKIADFDGDGKTDMSVYRNGTWFINRSSANDPNSYYDVSFFSGGDYLTPVDFDGDEKTDVAIWMTNYANSNAAFLILRSSTNTVRVTLFGITGDDPRVVGDWDGDGRADPAVYRNGASAGTQSYFYYLPSSAPENYVSIAWGLSGDEAVRGDFDGDGRKDAAVYRPSNQIWYVLQSSNFQALFRYWGLATDKRVEGDFDGDGKTDFVVYRDGAWYVLQSSNDQPRYASWGISGDKIVAGDYDGDGKTDFAVWRAGVYYILQNSNSQQLYRNFGIPGDIPVVSAFVH